MKKSIIWLLTAVMAITFGTLLYFQIMYLENMVKMRESQFSEGVVRALHSTVEELERQETLYYLEEDINIMESTLVMGKTPDNSTVTYQINPNQNASPISKIQYPSATTDISERYHAMQESIKSHYLYQRGLLNEVILNIMRNASNRTITERADSVVVRDFLTKQLEANGIVVPFVFAICSNDGATIYQTRGFINDGLEKYSTPLFPNTDNRYKLIVEFPTKSNYIFSSVRFIIPTLALTVMLLVIFLYTIILAFRQKKLTEMKADFINNMTHEFKTPISTISLAAQMLSDDSVLKSPSTLKHISGIINDESKRLRFQVEKVLQLSMFDNAGGSINFSTVDANNIIYNIVNTHKLKVEKLGGDITMHLDATNSEVYLDEMHFTNVIFNLLDNAVKYMKKDAVPHLNVTTRNYSDDMIEIRVKDNGIGIKKEDIKRIFDKFYRVSTGNLHDVKGFGLGLAYVKKMVNIFGGSIEVESDPGKWSEFIIRLPLVTKSSE
ncbi:MAG: HAMP domain-containing histidine kinase [Muribaculaceae bacterium]|nr:HAMP domain-containing histidine kinase [Muribaculaceae bacterium]